MGLLTCCCLHFVEATPEVVAAIEEADAASANITYDVECIVLECYWIEKTVNVNQHY